MRAVIFANGVLKKPRSLTETLKPDDLLIAADGGLHHFRALEIFPDVVIGDLDSITYDQRKALNAQETKIIQHSPRKDETDLALALLYAVKAGANKILVFGALGARWDMTLGNILLLTHPELRQASVVLVDGEQEMRLLRDGETFSLNGQPGDTVSLLPLGGDAVGVTTRGLEYPLHAETLKYGRTRGLSNVLQSASAQVNLQKGLLFVTIIRKNA